MSTETAGGLIKATADLQPGVVAYLEDIAAEDGTPLATMIRQMLARQLRFGDGVIEIPPAIRVRGEHLTRVSLVLTPDQLRSLDGISGLLRCSRSALIRFLLAREIGQREEAA